ncbi:LamG domain-containing protein [Botrimarina mediterranea]|uniref:LamG domain-containing protein n=1 Tax=Botrimarina mediterranea TaxID=2528022 RepID=UPI0011898FC5|nr:hypothetical protein K2D_02360 [Planctomycetes bacterium K2D]
MDKQQREQHDVLRRWLLVCDGQATPDEEARLFAQIAADEELQAMVACVAQDQSTLERCLSERQLENQQLGDQLGGVAGEGAAARLYGGAADALAGRHAVPARRNQRTTPRANAWSLFPLPAGTGALAATLLIGVVFGAWLVGGRGGPTPVASVDSPQSVFVAKVSNCVWGAAPEGIGANSLKLRDGEVVELLEGFAALSIESTGWRADVQLEGPAAIVLSSEGLPILRYGKMLVDLSSSVSSRGVTLDLPLSRLHLSAGAKVGIASLDNESEIHVFSGFATLESRRDLSNTDLLTVKGGLLISAGESCSITSSQGVVTKAEQGDANPGLFDAEGLIRGGDIRVTDDYIGAVRQSSPIAYYRFETFKDNSFVNEVQDKFHLHAKGPVRVAGLPGNRYVNFYVGDIGSRYLATEEPITDELPADYSVEFWMNPSHHHTATIVSFLVPELEPSIEAAQPPTTSKHGLLIEIGGYSGDALTMRPQKLRYLHRHSPDSVGGTQLFSDGNHAVREWQHVTCVKSADQMRLFLNGKLAGQTQEVSDLAEGLAAVVGQISDARTSRMYFGELDELAIYDRALSEDEIGSHYRAMGAFEGHSNGL